jgi:arylsulfatase A-like enzyme
VFILADDLGYGDVGAFGATDIRTPNIDRLAKSGIKFTEFYAPSPVCSPTRAGFLTGRYPRRMGVDGVFFPESFTGLPASEVTVAEALKEKGYATGIVGKWHLGHHLPYLPLQNGFDEYFGIPYSNDMQGVVYLRGNDVAEYKVDQRYTTRVYTEEAVGFIERHRQQPFFLYLAHTMPHVPLYRRRRFGANPGGACTATWSKNWTGA